MYTVLVADDNTSWLESLSDALNQDGAFEVVALASNGTSALKFAESLRPDIMILDIIMPECDGVYIVNYIRKHMPDYHPVIYMLSGIGSNTIITILNELDIDFYSMKPIPLSLILENVKRIISSRGKSTPSGSSPVPTSSEHSINNFILQLGLPLHLACSKYLAQALQYYKEDPECFCMLTKVLYPHIARLNKSSTSAIERSFRFAIKRMQTENTDLYREIFRFHLSKKITNSVFLNSLATYLDTVTEK